jgi:hypothetical protein
LVDGCVRTFEVKNSGMESADIRSLQLILSGESISDVRSHGFVIGFVGKCESRVSVSELFKSGDWQE